MSTRSNRSGTGSTRRRNSSTGKKTASKNSSTYKRSTSRSRSGQKKSGTVSRSGKKTSSKEPDINEINRYHDRKAFHKGLVFLVLIILAVFLYMCFCGLCHSLGKIITGLFFGIFGWFSWVLPVYVLIVFLFFAANGCDRRVIRGTICSIFAVIALEGFIQIITDEEVLSEYIETRRVLHGTGEAFILALKDLAAGGKANGGMIAEFFISHESRYVGTAATVLIQVAVMMISVFVFYGTDAMAHIRKKNEYRQEMEKKIDEIRENDDSGYKAPDYNPVHARKPKFYNVNDENDISDTSDKSVAADFPAPDTTNNGENNTHEISGDADRGSGKRRLKKRRKRSDFQHDSDNIKKDSGSYSSTDSGVDSDSDLNTENPEYMELKDVSYVVEPDSPDSFTQYDENHVNPYENDNEVSEGNSSGHAKRSAGRNKLTEGKESSDGDMPVPADISYEDAETEGNIGRGKAQDSGRTHPRRRDTASYSKRGRQAPQTLKRKDSEIHEASFTADLNHNPEYSSYIYPSLDLLNETGSEEDVDEGHLKDMAVKLEETLRRFGVDVSLGDVTHGPSVTRFELIPAPGVRVNRITSLIDDIKLSLAVPNVRIQAPIPGKSAVGVEIPNKSPGTVSLRELLRSKEFKNAKSNIAFAVGKDIYGRVVVTDIAKMPHLLIAGATGSGKSVCINTLIMSILYKSSPDDVKLLMIDPKIVELNVYNGIPHLFCPVVTDPNEAAASLNWAVSEMEKRYKMFKDLGVRNIKGYNEKIRRIENAAEQGYRKMPSMVIIVDEFADLMMVASKDVEKAIMRLAQLARAAGIHIVLATQRPSVNIITGVIKANIPSRIAFSVSSAIDSRTILDMSGAERLIGKGDMLFYPEGYTEPVRLQGAFVSDEEIENVVNFIKENNEKASYDPSVERAIKQNVKGSDSSTGKDKSKPERDEYFADAARFCVGNGRASAGQLQRKFSIGFNRAGRLLDQLCEAGIVGESEGTKPRKILVDAGALEEILGEGNVNEEQGSEEGSASDEILTGTEDDRQVPEETVQDSDNTDSEDHAGDTYI